MEDDPQSKPTEQVWFGQLDQFEPLQLAARNALADAAKRGDWESVLRDVTGEQGSANLWRPNGSSWFSPLHQAAWNRAPVAVVEKLIANGAWRTLRTAGGDTAGDIAVRKGHSELVDVLAPIVRKPVATGVLSKLDEYLAALVESRIRPHLTIRLRVPPAEVLTEIPGNHLWFPIPGMYGGFSIRLVNAYLHVESWSRVVGGSGQIHVVTAEGITLVEEGFM